MNEIAYELREQDLVAFNEHQLEYSEGLQKSLRRHQAILPGIIILIALFFWFYYQNTLSAIYVAAIGIAWGVLVPLSIRWSMRRQIRNLYSEEIKANLLGHYRLRAEPKALVELTPHGESRVEWNDLLRVEMTKKYAYVFLDVDTALIIPRATLQEGDLHEFIGLVDQRLDEAA